MNALLEAIKLTKLSNKETRFLPLKVNWREMAIEQKYQELRENVQEIILVWECKESRSTRWFALVTYTYRPLFVHNLQVDNGFPPLLLSKRHGQRLTGCR